MSDWAQLILVAALAAILGSVATRYATRGPQAEPIVVEVVREPIVIEFKQAPPESMDDLFAGMEL